MTSHQIATHLLDEMTAETIGQIPPHLRGPDSPIPCPTYQTQENRARILPHIEAMVAQGWRPTLDDLSTIAAGDQDEADEMGSPYDAYAPLSEALGDIHENGESPHVS